MKRREESLERVELTVLACDRSRYNYALWSQFALSIIIDCYCRGREMQRSLFDTGWSAEPLFQNLRALGLRIERRHIHRILHQMLQKGRMGVCTTTQQTSQVVEKSRRYEGSVLQYAEGTFGAVVCCAAKLYQARGRYWGVSGI